VTSSDSNEAIYVKYYSTAYLTATDGGDGFGDSIALVHDVNRDGVDDVIVGAPMYSTPSIAQNGAAVLFRMEGRGRWQSYEFFLGEDVGLSANDYFASSLSTLPDVDGDSRRELAAGFIDGFAILHLKNGKIRSYSHVLASDLGLDPTTSMLGTSLSSPASIDATLDAGYEIVAGDPTGSGQIFFIRIFENETAVIRGRVSASMARIPSSDTSMRFGAAIAVLPDLDLNGALDIAVGSPGFGDGDGLVSILFMSSESSSVQSTMDISPSDLDSGLSSGSAFGSAVTLVSTNHTHVTIAVGAPNDSTLFTESGAIVVICIDARAARIESDYVLRDLSEVSTEHIVVRPTMGAHMGAAVAGVGNLDESHGDDVFVGLPDMGCCGYFMQLYLYGGTRNDDDWDFYINFSPTPAPTDVPRSLSYTIVRLLGITITTWIFVTCSLAIFRRFFRNHLPPRVTQDQETAGRDIAGALPSLRFYETSCAAWLENGEDATCAICLCDFERDDEVKVLPCGHTFHTACADACLQRSPLCPLCRFDLRTTPGSRNPEDRTPTTASRPPAEDQGSVEMAHLRHANLQRRDADHRTGGNSTNDDIGNTHAADQGDHRAITQRAQPNRSLTPITARSVEIVNAPL